MTGSDPLKDLEKLVEEFRQSGLRELHARAGEIEIYLSQDGNAAGLDGPKVAVSTQAAPAALAPVTAAPQSAKPAAASSAQPAVAIPDNAVVVAAPYLGTFYRAPKPGSPSYVELGSGVEVETEICLVEVMKLFTAVRAGVSGTIAAILAKDGELVEAGQPLFAIRPR